MKSDVNAQLKKVNPIELYRIKQELSQAEFAERLGYTNAGNYRSHCKRFSANILRKINDEFGVDLRAKVISHLQALLKAAAYDPDGAYRYKGNAKKSSYEEMVG